MPPCRVMLGRLHSPGTSVTRTHLGTPTSRAAGDAASKSLRYVVCPHKEIFPFVIPLFNQAFLFLPSHPSSGLSVLYFEKFPVRFSSNKTQLGYFRPVLVLPCAML